MKRDNEPASAAEILSKMVQSSDLGAHLEHARIWRRWPELVGPRLGAHGRPQTIRDGVLRVEVDSAVWMHRYTLKKWDILKRINRMCGKEIVSDIFVVLLKDEESLEPDDDAGE